MLNLSTNDPSKIAEVGYEFNIVLPDGTETEAKIKVRGQLSPVVKAYGRKVYQEFKVREQAAKRRGKEPEDITIEEAEELAARGAAVRVIGWSNLGIEEGKELAFNKENCEMLMQKYPFIRDQVMEESDKITNFRFD